MKNDINNSIVVRKNSDKIIPYKCVVKGDNLYASIASASILAKVSRDNYIKDMLGDKEVTTLDDIKRLIKERL